MENVSRVRLSFFFFFDQTEGLFLPHCWHWAKSVSVFVPTRWQRRKWGRNKKKKSAKLKNAAVMRKWWKSFCWFVSLETVAKSSFPRVFNVVLSGQEMAQNYVWGKKKNMYKEMKMKNRRLLKLFLRHCELITVFKISSISSWYRFWRNLKFHGLTFVFLFLSSLWTNVFWTCFSRDFSVVLKKLLLVTCVDRALLWPSMIWRIFKDVYVALEYKSQYKKKKNSKMWSEKRFSKTD